MSTDGDRPVILAVAEDFESLLGPLGWLAEAGYDVRACLGPLAADRVCGMFERDGACLELASCDLLLTNEPLAHPAGKPRRRDLIQQARLRREELPILVVSQCGVGDLDDAAGAVNASVVPPHRGPVLERVAALLGAAVGGTSRDR